MTKCVICEKRPAIEDGFCSNCAGKVNSLRRNNGQGQPSKFLTYKGHVVGLYPNGDGKLIARLLKRDPKFLPKSRTINLDVYCKGFTREMIKRFKRCVLSLAHA